MVPDTISHFKLLHELGRGASGVVVRAQDLADPSYEVAVKLVYGPLGADERALASLRRERDALARLCHPGVVQLRDWTAWQGGAALILEALDGETLEARLGRGPLPVAEVVILLRQLLDALGYAHRLEPPLLHRDLKPSNLFLLRSGHVKILDFGLAHSEGEGAPSTTGRLAEGTWAYLAPEIWDGGPATAAADVYAVGLIAWELLTGRPACPDGPLPARVRWHQQGRLARPSELRPEVPPWLDALVAELASRDPAARPRDGAEAAARLRAAIARAEGGASSVDAHLRWRPRFSLLAGFVLGTLLTLRVAPWAEPAPPPPALVEHTPNAAPPAGPAQSPPPEPADPPEPVVAPAAPSPTPALVPVAAPSNPPAERPELAAQIAASERELQARLVDGAVVTALELRPASAGSGRWDVVLIGAWTRWRSLLQAAEADPQRQREAATQRAALARLCAAIGEATAQAAWSSRAVVLEDGGRCAQTMSAAHAREAATRLSEARARGDAEAFTAAVDWTLNWLTPC